MIEIINISKGIKIINNNLHNSNKRIKLSNP